MYPGLAVVAEIQKQQARGLGDTSRPEFLYVGRVKGIEQTLSQRAGIPFQPIDVGGIRGVSTSTAARNLWRSFKSVGKVRAIIRTFKPNAIFATGGYVSAPVIWASALEKIPSVVYLPDLEPGWAIRASARWATRIAISFPEVAKFFPREKSVVTGYPVRAGFYQTDRAGARRKFDLDPNAHTVTIFGGSRGAHRINEAVAANLADLTRLSQLIIITGRDDEEWVNSKVPDGWRARVRVFGYLDDDFPSALAAADVVVARAGAATLGEFPALGLPAVVVPYPFAGQHQERNAKFLVEHGAAIQVDDLHLRRDLVPMLKKLLDAPEQLKAMGDAARRLAQPNAAANIASLLYSMAKSNE